MSRTLYIDNFDPDLIDGFEIDQIRPDAVPDKTIDAVRLALADGQKLVGSAYVNKRIIVKAHFFAGTRAAYEAGRDALLGVLDSDVLSTLQFEQSGEDRRYFATYENVVFDYKDNGTCFVTITYLCTDPFGYKVEETVFYEQTGITTEVNEVIESGGNIYGLPKISATINDIDDDENERTFSLTISQGANSRNMQITRIWQPNDTVSIDAKKQRVYVNGQQYQYTGRFPQFIKTNTLRFNMVDAASFDADLKITYNERYL